MKRTAGFTLMEILVVIILVGVMAAIVVPTYSGHVQRSYALEAASAAAAVAQLTKTCLAENNNDSRNCDTFDQINMDDPSSTAGNAGAHFDYAITSYYTIGTPSSFEVRATRNTLDGGTTTDYIAFTYPHTGVNACNGTGAFARYRCN
jgi:prepilin-type N-terminal cleavage/methylation domain-containing protein